MSDQNNRNGGTRAIVTGGAQGIGFAVASQLVADGRVSSDGPAGLRAIIGGPAPPHSHRPGAAGRWFALADEAAGLPKEQAVETLAWALLRMSIV